MKGLVALGWLYLAMEQPRMPGATCSRHDAQVRTPGRSPRAVSGDRTHHTGAPENAPDGEWRPEQAGNSTAHGTTRELPQETWRHGRVMPTVPTDMQLSARWKCPSTKLGKELRICFSGPRSAPQRPESQRTELRACPGGASGGVRGREAAEAGSPNSASGVGVVLVAYFSGFSLDQQMPHLGTQGGC